MGVARLVVRGLLKKREREIRRSLADPPAAQERLLLELVRKAEATEWGRKHSFAKIRSVRDFQSAVPVSRYEEMAPWWHRAFENGRDVTWPGHIRYFALTSGTTLGASKVMPVSSDAIRLNRRSGLTLLCHVRRQAAGGSVLAGKVLYLGGCTELKRRGSCWQGDASGINARHIPWLARRYRLPGPGIAALSDWEAKMDAICRRHLESPVAAVVGLPSWTLILFRRLVDHASERLGRKLETVKEVWPDLAAFVHFGMAFSPYRPQFEEIVGGRVAFIDTYSSSEGGLNAIQSRQDDASMQLEVDGGTFFEFVPLEQAGRPEAPRLTLAEVEIDKPYALLLSTVSGIWAYDVGDVVRFTSLDPPKIVFAARTSLQLNVFGEHVLQEHLDNAMAGACAGLGAKIKDFTVVAVLPTASEPRGCHRWLVEFDGPPPEPRELGRRLDALVKQASDDYAAHRCGDFGLRPPEVRILKPGTFYAWAKRSGKLGGQHKVPRIASSAEMAASLCSLSAE